MVLKSSRTVASPGANRTRFATRMMIAFEVSSTVSAFDVISWASAVWMHLIWVDFAAGGGGGGGGAKTRRWMERSVVGWTVATAVAAASALPPSSMRKMRYSPSRNTPTSDPTAQTGTWKLAASVASAWPCQRGESSEAGLRTRRSVS